MVKPKPKLKDFVPQRLNANDHTERGMRMLAQSIEKNGVIGAMTVAANGETFDGSATWETCVQTFGEDVEPIVIRSDGSRPVIHIREDLETADDPRAIELGIAANRVAEMNLSYNLDVLSEIGKDIDLSSMIYPNDHLNELLESFSKGEGFSREDGRLESPEDFKEYGEDIETEHCCPKCGYKWSGGK